MLGTERGSLPPPTHTPRQLASFPRISRAPSMRKTSSTGYGRPLAYSQLLRLNWMSWQAATKETVRGREKEAWVGFTGEGL